MKLVIPLLKASFWATVLAIPVLGIWIASSLAAYGNGPTWMAVLGGALLFPVLPLAWEAFAARRRSRKKAKSSGSFLDDLDSRRRTEHVLNFGDRLLIRTLAINVVFVFGLLALSPRTAFNALTARGDWFLDNVEQPWVAKARLTILRGADKAEWLANLQEPNPYADMGEEPTEVVVPEPIEVAPSRVSVSVTVPDGATAQLGDELPPLRIEGGSSVDLEPDKPLSIRVFYDDGRKELCSYTPHELDEIAFVDREGSLFLQEGPALRPCIRMQEADPKWIPELWLLDRRGFEAGPKITSDKIAAVKIREPYYRVELTTEAGEELCEITRKNPWFPLALVVEGEIRFRTPQDSETQCTGSVSFPMFELPEGAEPPAEPPEQVDGQWPMALTLHPLIADFPEEHESSIALIGKYIRDNEEDPWQRVKALHDYVVTHITYDKSSLEEGRRAPQDADTVFRTGTGVCAGYANLMVALGHASGDEIVYVTGDARQDLGDIAGAPHAWNAARIDGHWVLMDVTWDVGNSSSGSFEERYSTDYLFTPPEVFRLSHRPDDERWQLAVPMSAGEFNRQPLLRPAFFAADLGLTDPNRAQVTVSGDAVIRISNPKRAEMRVMYESNGARKPCKITGNESLEVTCSFPGKGTYDVLMFQQTDPTKDYYVYGGRIQFNR